MSARPLELTQRQVRALCEGAKKAGFVPVVQFGKTLVRLVPAEKAEKILEAGEVDEPERIVPL